MKIAYFDCFAGAGGDMIVAAMLDAGLDAEFLKAQLATLLRRVSLDVWHKNGGFLADPREGMGTRRRIRLFTLSE